jgi:hypothetical protein
MNRLTETCACQLSCPERDGDGPCSQVLNQRSDRMELQFNLHNDPNLIYPLVTYLQERTAAFCQCSSLGEMRIGIALEEALLNALYHGNLELGSDELHEASDEFLQYGHSKLIAERQQESPFKNRCIHLKVELAPGEARFVVRDDGPGFDYAVCTPLVIDDGELARPSGRGLMLMHTFMDEVWFNEIGNQVTMCIHRAIQPSTSSVHSRAKEDNLN